MCGWSSPQTCWVKILSRDGAQQVPQVILMCPQFGKIWCTTVLLKLDRNADSDSVGMGWDPRLPISNKLPGVAKVACPWTILWAPWHRGPYFEHHTLSTMAVVKREQDLAPKDLGLNPDYINDVWLCDLKCNELSFCLSFLVCKMGTLLELLCELNI